MPHSHVVLTFAISRATNKLIGQFGPKIRAYKCNLIWDRFAVELCQFLPPSSDYVCKG